MDPKLMAILVIDPFVLRKLLHLPDGVEIIDFCVPFNRRGVLEMKVEGVGWPISEGMEIARTFVGSITDLENGKFKIDWDLPLKGEKV